ncbi:hypothetical protein ACIREE_32205 [Streptomyces sp. NPDC102467]|uniref:hypothetical protein n=1 Tax=Streptomyces sp. NPDC102467 TaxID=3366179 RepID=UPI003822808F
MTKAEDVQDELGLLIGQLSREGGAFVRYGRLPESGGRATLLSRIAVEVHAVAVEAHDVWAPQDSYVQAPASLVQVEAGLVAYPPDEAAALMVRFASEDLLWKVPLMDGPRAHSLTSRVVEVLGPDARWWSNHDDVASDCVTGCTVDGLVAGTDGTHFAVLLQACVD